MKVYIPSPLRSYTGQKDQVDVTAATLAEALLELDRGFPGIRFRIINEQGDIREHIKIFVNQNQANTLSRVIGPNDDIMILCALSGG
jgi:molybdopterin synthase sulfur carrier subunit